jgi:hypothetical protein
LLIGKALGQERRRTTHSLAHDPHFGRSVVLLAEMPFQRADVQTDMHCQLLHPETLLPDNNPQFIRLGKTCAHDSNTFETASIFQTSSEIFWVPRLLWRMKVARIEKRTRSALYFCGIGLPNVARNREYKLKSQLWIEFATNLTYLSFL